MIKSFGINDHQPSLLADMNDVCPICKGDRYLNPNMAILVGPCFHIMCNKCVDRLFSLDPAPCPTCGQTLRKVDFYQQTFEDLEVEKEVRIRKKLARSYNLLEDDFKTLKEYDEYLEELEDVTFNLVNDIDVEETNARIELHKKKFAENIKRNIERKAIEDRFFAQKEENERRRKIDKKDLYLQELDSEKKRKLEQKEELIEKIAHSSEGISDIVKKHRQEEKKQSQLSMFGSSAQSAENRPGILSFTQLKQLESENFEEEAHFDAHIPFHLPLPTFSKIKSYYIDPILTMEREKDKEKEKLAITGGYFYRHSQHKAIQFLHYGITTPLP